MRIDNVETAKRLINTRYTFNKRTGVFSIRHNLTESTNKKTAHKLLLMLDGGSQSSILKGVAAWALFYDYLPSWTMRREKVLRHDDSKGFTKDNIYLKVCRDPAIKKRGKEIIPFRHKLKEVRDNRNIFMWFVSQPFIGTVHNERA